MDRHNSCVNTRAIIDYIDRHYGRAEELLQGLHDPILRLPDPLSFLSDPHNWVSGDLCRQLYENARVITGDPDVAYKIGFESVVYKRLGYIQNIMVRALGTPRGILSRLQAINDKFNRNKDVEIVRSDRKCTTIRLHWHAEVPVGPDFCLMNKGVYSALPTVVGLPPARLVENKCFFQGDDFCEYHITWENPSLRDRLRLLFTSRKHLLRDTISEVERGKELIERKYREVQALNLKLQQKVDQLISIQQASGAVLSEFDFSRLIPRILRIFINEIGYTRGLIMLVDQERQTLYYAGGVGENGGGLENLDGYAIPLSRKENIMARVAQNGQPVMVQDAASLNLNPQNLIIRSFHPQSIVLLPLTARGKVIGVLAADRDKLGKTQPQPDRDYLQGFTNQVALAIENAQMYRELKDKFLKTVQTLVAALEAKDPYTRGHSERVTEYAVRLARAVRQDEAMVDRIQNMGLVHDIGKIGIDRPILHKDTQLSDAELEIIRRHPTIGLKIIEPLGLSAEETAVVRNHHERFDGQGYPDRLSGERIPIQVRIVSICDAFDAMTTDRPYRDALPLNEALRRLNDAGGSQFDPELVESFIRIVRKGELKDLLGDKSWLRVA